MTDNSNYTLEIWRQESDLAKGNFETYKIDNISPDMSFLEMIDVLNERLLTEGIEPVAFDHDCREGICGNCGAMVNGRAHGPEKETTLCQLFMRHFDNGDTIVVEPWRSKAFKVIKDLVVDRSPFDTLIQSDGFISVNTGNAPEANTIPIQVENAEKAMDAAACIGCGACVAACPNSSAMLFISARASHFALLPQGKTEAAKRVKSLVDSLGANFFGSCSNHRECEAECPKNVSIINIARLNREYIKSGLNRIFKK